MYGEARGNRVPSDYTSVMLPRIEQDRLKSYILCTTSNGVTIRTGFASYDLAARAMKRALANGASYASVEVPQ